MQPLVYKGKNGWIIILTTLLFNLLPFCMLAKSLSTPFGCVILVFYYAFDLILFPIIIKNKVLLYEDHFIFFYGFTKKRYELSSLMKIEKTRTAIASSANSLDRIYLNFKGDELCLSLKDNPGFMKEVQKRTPTVQLTW